MSAAVQRKVFARWANVRLRERGLSIDADALASDMRDGYLLCALLECLSGERLPHKAQRVSSRILAIQNVHAALSFMRRRPGVRLVNISAEDVVDGNEKLILGVLWTLISSEIGSDSERSAKEGLLLWCRQHAAPLPVTDFRRSFHDGRVLCALVRAFRPELVAGEHAGGERGGADLLRFVFDVAERRLGIAPLLDVEDVAGEVADERAVMTYVSQFWHEFSKPDDVAALKRCVALRREATALVARYEQHGDLEAYHRLQALLRRHDEPAYTPPAGKELAQVAANRRRRRTLDAAAKRAAQWIAERRPAADVRALLDEIDGIAAEDASADAGAASAPAAAAADASRSLNEQWARARKLDAQACVLDRLEDELASLDTHDELERVARRLVDASDTLDKRLQQRADAIAATVSRRRAHLRQHDEYRALCAWTQDACRRLYAGERVDLAEQPSHSSADARARLGSEWDEFCRDVHQAAAARDTFHTFDRDHDGRLQPHEFNGAAAALGIDATAGEHASGDTLPSLLALLRARRRTSPSRALAGFRAIARGENGDGGSRIGEEAVREAFNDEATAAAVDDLLAQLRRFDFDYAAFTRAVLAHDVTAAAGARSGD